MTGRAIRKVWGSAELSSRSLNRLKYQYKYVSPSEYELSCVCGAVRTDRVGPLGLLVDIVCGRAYSGNKTAESGTCRCLRKWPCRKSVTSNSTGPRAECRSELEVQRPQHLRCVRVDRRHRRVWSSLCGRGDSDVFLHLLRISAVRRIGPTSRFVPRFEGSGRSLRAEPP